MHMNTGFWNQISWHFINIIHIKVYQPKDEQTTAELVMNIW